MITNVAHPCGLSRLLSIATLAVTVLVFSASPSSAIEPLPLHGLNEDKIHTQPWFENTFLDIGEDIETAIDEDKQLLVIWEQQGCGACTKMHEINLRHPQIVDYMRRNFFVVQMNMRGVKEVTALDGEVMPERDFRGRAAVIRTPTLQFYPVDASDAQGKTGKRAEAYRFEGYWKPELFLNLMVFVKHQHFKKEPNFMTWYQKGEGIMKLVPVKGVTG